jgi:hypothetical protein
MKMNWYVKRLTAMSVSEMQFRMRRVVQARLERLGVGLADPPEASVAAGCPWVTAIPTQFDALTYVGAADRIISGKFDLFALRPATVGFPPNWNRDPRTGIVAPLVYGKMLDYRDNELVGDIKYLWELNRHLELVTLAQAWHVSRQPRYSDACCKLLESWFEQCPYPLGANWTSSLEHGIRLMNWAVAWQLLQTAPVFSDPQRREFVDRWRTSVYQHCHFTLSHHSYYSSANNHLLGELAGLLIGTLTWPCWPESSRWIERAHRQFEAQCLVQTSPDGVNREQADWYHHLVADMMLITGLFARANGRDFGAPYWQRLERMMEFIASIMNVAGQVPAFGDADDAVLVRFCPGQADNVYRSLLATCGLLFERRDFLAKSGAPDDKARWLLGDTAMARYADRAYESGAQPIRKAFPDGGYYVLGDRIDSQDELRIVADAGPLGYLSLAAHGHADALSFTLSKSGHELLVDSGTYAYHTQREWREYFRGTAAHNTLRVDGLDQSVQTGSFLWGKRATVGDVDYQSDESGDRLSAAHDGYARLRSGARVARQLNYDRAHRIVSVHDELRSRGPHLVEIFWHFSEHCVVTLAAHSVVASCQGTSLTLTWPAGLNARLVRGQEHPPLGWRSKSYDVRIPIDTLVVSGNIDGDWRGTTTIAINPDEPAAAH